jgi:histidinol phosphatase-like enzyme
MDYKKQIKQIAKKRLQKAVVFDFDGTITIEDIHPPSAPTAPNKDVVAKMKELKDRGFKIIISSCRWSTELNSEKVAEKNKKEIEKYLQDNNIPFDELWAPNKPKGYVYVDDHGVNVKDLGEIDKIIKKEEK